MSSGTLAAVLKPSLNWALVFIPSSVYLEHFHSQSHLWIFFSACLAIIPLAGLLGEATEHIAERTGEGIGGLLNATFGNAAELIIAIVALRAGFVDVVKASLTGSIIGNILLVLGAALLAGGFYHKIQQFNPMAARTQAAMLVLASIALVIPALFHSLRPPHVALNEAAIGLAIAALLIVVAIVGNAAEHSTAVLVAMKNRMDLSFSIAIGSSTQIALFVAPLLVVLSYVIAPQPMDLIFTRGEVLAVILSTFMMAFAVGDGRSNWFMGAQLLAVYLILAVAFYFTPG